MNVKEKKQATVDELHEKLESASAFYLADFTGLTVKKVTELRRRLRKAGIEYVVVKNTLAERALEGLDVPDVGQFFKGPTAVAFGVADPVAAGEGAGRFRERKRQPPRNEGGSPRSQGVHGRRGRAAGQTARS